MRKDQTSGDLFTESSGGLFAGATGGGVAPMGDAVFEGELGQVGFVELGIGEFGGDGADLVFKDVGHVDCGQGGELLGGASLGAVMKGDGFDDGGWKAP